jgi:hypothetical protein
MEYKLGSLDKPVIDLGGLGRFTLGDITKGRRKALKERYDALEALDDDAHDDTAILLMCGLVEAACESGDGVAKGLAELYDTEVIGERDLSGLLLFVADWISEVDAAGND